MASGLTGAPLRVGDGFNWIYFVELLVCAVLTIFFLFYFNRLFGTIVSYAIRAFTWHKYQAYIDIQSLQISLLAGRIFFKDIRYHAHNQTILVHGGYITWQYWLRTVQDTDVFDPSPHRGGRGRSASSSRAGSQSRSRSVDREEKAGSQETKKLPYRITVKVSGLEAFIYNRSPVYDSILANITKKREHGQTANAPKRSQEDEMLSQFISETSRASRDHRPGHEKEMSGYPAGYASHPEEDILRQPNPPPSFLRLFPIHVDCNKGAVALGNENTTSVLTAQFEKASGEFSATHSGPLDVYRQLFNFEFIHPVVHMRKNHDFKSLQLATAARLKKNAEDGELSDKTLNPHQEDSKRKWRPWNPFATLWNTSTESIKMIASKHGQFQAGQPSFPGQERWQGLSRYVHDSQNDEHDEWDGVEYGKTSLIADVPRLRMSFYWDVPGPVSTKTDPPDSGMSSENINGDLPPAYGMDLQVYGGTINYGPWADRQRINLQNIFFPANHVDAIPATPLSKGQTRASTIFKLFISIEQDTTIRIPMREASKDWKWKGKASDILGGDKNDHKDTLRSRIRPGRNKNDKGAGATVRPFAWLDVKVLGNTTVNYDMDMFARNDGYRNLLDVDFSGTEISSSVNHGLLWRTGQVTVSSNMSNPLVWNKLRKWTFEIKINDLDLFILRDHLFLITDLITDWSSGPPPDYFTFTPMQYLLTIDFNRFKMYLNTNDSNIVNNPSELEENNFVILFGRQLHGEVTIPLDRFCPAQSEIPFDVKGQDLGLDLSMSPRNTLHTFVRSPHVARLGNIRMRGSHSYFTTTAPNLTDRLHFDIDGSNFSLTLYGFLIRQLLVLKENYFGEDLHFKTLEEYQSLQPGGLGTGDQPEDQNGRHNKSNDLDVILCITASECNALLPSNIYSADHGIRVDLPYASADLRFTNYYMDLETNFSPLSVSLGNIPTDPDGPAENSGQTEIFIDSASIVGHRLFGLPPTEPTYVCNWDFTVGETIGECSVEFLDELASSAQGFAFSLDDYENALPVLNPIELHDVTFLRLNTSLIRIWLHIGQEALLISCEPVKLDFNDWAGKHFSQRLNVQVPKLVIACADASTTSRHRTSDGHRQSVMTHAYLDTSISLSMVRRKLGFTADRQLQQDHIYEHDKRTKRTDFLLINNHADLARSKSINNTQTPALIFPPMPLPVGVQIDSMSTSSLRTPTQYEASIKGSIQMQRNMPTATLSRSSTENLPDWRKQPSTTTMVSSKGGCSDDWVSSMTTDHQLEGQPWLPASIALTSSLAPPYFPMHQIELDLADVDPLPVLETHHANETQISGKIQTPDATYDLDEDMVHTSFVVSTGQGIRIFCTPKAISVVASILEHILPKNPDSILDALQVSTLSTILDSNKRDEGKGKSNEVSISVPQIHVRLCNESSVRTDYGAHMETDQYDMYIRNPHLLLRSKSFPRYEAVPEVKRSLSVHATFSVFDLSIRQKQSGIESDDVAVSARVNDFLLWISQARTNSINVTVKCCEIANASKQINYLASLIHRTAVLATEVEKIFSDLASNWQSRLRYMVYYLSNRGKDVPDPTFLTRASYVGRVGPDHLRNSDSWKILSRLRFILQNLSHNDYDQLSSACRDQEFIYPEDSPHEIISLWDQWRAWDLKSVKKSLVMQKLYGPFQDVTVLDEAAELPLYINVKAAIIKAIIDPGPKQTDFSTQLFSAAVRSDPPPPPSGLHLVEQESRKTTIQLSSRNMMLKVNWEVCELIEKLLTMFKNSSARNPQKETRVVLGPPNPGPSKATKSRHDFHLVYATEIASIEMDCINVMLTCASQDVKISLAGYKGTESNQGVFVSAVASADNSGAHLRSRSRLLLRTEAEFPSIYISHHGNRETVDELRIIGACKVAAIELTEEILGLFEVADAVLVDEAAFVFQQIQKFPTDNKEQSKLDQRRSNIPKLTIALLMDTYYIDVTILPTLSYSIAGGIGRVSVSPRVDKELDLTVEFDLNGHKHSFYNKETSESTIITSLDIPAVNGRLKITQDDDITKLSLISTLDMVTFEASSIHGLLNIAKDPEMSRLTHAIQEDAEVLRGHFKEIFPKEKDTYTVKAPKSGSFIYYVKLTMAGLQIVANAPTQYAISTTAALVIGMEDMQLNVSNISAKDSLILVLPDVAADVRRVGVSLALSNEEICQRSGNVTLGVNIRVTSADPSNINAKRVIRVSSSNLDVNIYAETASAMVDVMNHLQDRLKDIDLSRQRKYFRRLHRSKFPRSSSAIIATSAQEEGEERVKTAGVFTSTYSLELNEIQVSWVVGHSSPRYGNREPEDLVLSFRRIDLSTRAEDKARLMIEDMQLQMVPPSFGKKKRSLNSALLPEVVFNVAYSSSQDARKLAFQAAGKSLDLQLESKFIIPAKCLHQSITLATEKFRAATSSWQKTPTVSGAERKNPFGNKRLSSLLVDADFAGAVVHLRAASYQEHQSPQAHARENPGQQKGKYGQFVTEDSAASTSLRAPGVALKAEFTDDGGKHPSLNVELKVDASNNALYPSVVPLIVDISNAVKQVVQDKDNDGAKENVLGKAKPAGSKLIDEESLMNVDPSTYLGKTRLNFGFRICRQEFSLSCQPIARVAASARLDEIYMTMSSVKTKDHGHFFAITGAFEKLQASVQHVYSKESTFSFKVDSVHLSVMNSKHLSGRSGVSAILKINPTRTQINARQLQDFLLFREIWVPPEIRQEAHQTPSAPSTEPQEYLVQRYHQVASAAAFPWNATFAIAEMAVELDLGQAIGKSSLTISNMWASSKKNSDWEQNLCIGVDRVGIKSTGRMNGNVDLTNVKVRTSIRWPEQQEAPRQTPFIQASAGFGRLNAKIGFDYQVFAVADISDFEFLMYNVRQGVERDRLVAILDGDRVQVFLTSTSSAQVVALYQAIQRLVQENQSAYEQSLKDIERFLRRKSAVLPGPLLAPQAPSSSEEEHNADNAPKAPISLGTDVVVTLKKLTFGAFPSSLTDSQVLSLEASDTQARFATALTEDPLKGAQVHSVLGLTLGRLSVALAAIAQTSKKDTPVDITVEYIVNSVAGARGGTILRVPKVLATMQTWQIPNTNTIEYQFKSSFEGKVDVGWNYSRISYIRNMWSAHTRALASRLGKPLPEPAVKISAPKERPETAQDREKAKITAVVDVPQSRYEYAPLGEVVIETPQLRDMGEATPPLEWIGLHRDRLPNVTHQIVIVPLLEIAREVEDAYQRILGTS
ncbi:hypothetical protein EJ05DRAFT_509028 [Pseudovirgaria hyperparasitica]|uniref:Fermentation associated protein n=1 Tax=Pseudovirgaria hyperparasitica TaxID=470096 RepID=A0A6A6WFW9_9PEZI|nr:uncharacterized protein EJ05DRAFT_509028 [Pseudovirgaria hyperparasitica]KAF2760497.1 hypothetical protein EJ05DRAFT_509028 [Pseudovirgaria hyperparasitica]